MKKDLNALLGAVRDEKLTWNAFVGATQAEFTAMAMSLVRRWKPPSWYGITDVVQELYLWAWRFLPNFDPSRGKTIKQFVVYNAMSGAKRELHRARGAKLSGTADKNPSRIEAPISSLSKTSDDGATFAEFLLGVEPAAETAMIAAEDRQKSVDDFASFCREDLESILLEDVISKGPVAGNLRAVGERLYRDAGTRLALNISHLGKRDGVDRATKFVVRSLAAVASRATDDPSFDLLMQEVDAELAVAS